MIIIIIIEDISIWLKNFHIYFLQNCLVDSIARKHKSKCKKTFMEINSVFWKKTSAYQQYRLWPNSSPLFHDTSNRTDWLENARVLDQHEPKKQQNEFFFLLQLISMKLPYVQMPKVDFRQFRRSKLNNHLLQQHS
jgi:hypothetical protein